MNLIKRCVRVIIRHFISSEKYAKLLGVQIGSNNFIANDKRIWSSEPYLIKIGSHCQITYGCRIFTHGGAAAVRNIFPNFDTFGKVVIGDYVYIGTNSLIMPGVTIGNNVIIAAGSVVTKSVPSNCVVAGNPARILTSIENYIIKNKTYNLESKELSAEEKKEMLLHLDDNMFITKNYMS